MRVVSFFLIFLFFLAFGVAVPAYFLGYFRASGAEQLFVVVKGENFAHVALRLQMQGVIRSERTFRWYVNFTSPAKKLKRGEFLLRSDMPIPEVLYALTEGKPMEYKVTIPEGQNIFQVAEILESKGLTKRDEFLKAVGAAEIISLLPTLNGSSKLPKSIEGYIYPDTYLLQKVFTAREVTQIFVQRFREVYATLAKEMVESVAVRELQLKPHEVVTLASIVEKETGADKERPLVAGLFYNRLRKHMRLQTDPTVIYGVWVRDGKWDGNIRKRDLETFTEYNTYQISGLPPGPIANPGINALRAVLQPENSEYLFFVSNNDGTHTFSRDFGAHKKAVKSTQLDPGAKEGKSWRDLSKEKRAK